MLSWQIVHQYNTDAEQLGSLIQVACAPVLDMAPRPILLALIISIITQAVNG